MNRTIPFIVVAAFALTPLAAQAQVTVNLTGTVNEQCALGIPDLVVLNLMDLTGPDGRLTAELLSATPKVQTDIPNAWCNMPSTLKIEAAPLSQAVAPGYNTPAGFSRLLTFDAVLEGWPAEIRHRPLLGSAASTTSANTPHAHDLTLSIASLQTLNADGASEAAGLVVEAGAYSTEIVISVGAQ